MFQNNPYLNPPMNGVNPYGNFYNQNYYPNMSSVTYPQQNMSSVTSNLNEVIAGAIVDSEDVVKSKNCSLDGTATYYPLSDKSAIYVKQLNPQTGAGMMLKYKLEMQNTTTTENQYISLLSAFKEELSQEINELKGLIEKGSEKPATTKPRSLTGGGK